MKPGPYFVALLLAVVCVGLTVALILMGHINQRMQTQLQAQQQALNQGILGQQAQQISGAVLQDLAGAAAGNSAIRQLLEKHGYRVSPAHSPAAPEAQLLRAGIATPSVAAPLAPLAERLAGGSSQPPGAAMNTEAPKP